MKIRAQRWRGEYWLRASLASAGVAAILVCAMFAAPPPSGAADDRPVVLFLGTSLTAGYGLPSAQAFPALIQGKIDRAGLRYRVVNAGVSGDTSAGGVRRIDWLLQSPVSVLVLELGANDMLRGLDHGAMRTNLVKIIERTRAAYPKAKLLIAGMRAAPNLGADYRRKFESIYLELANIYDAPLIPFLLQDVAAKPGLNQLDGIHPTAQGHSLVAERVWGKLLPLLA
ncbi:MAG: arylesterase, partial [Deltaproteobacteria bacterium]|nr:arylesterase [Deltaproteobacteria bacterium]